MAHTTMRSNDSHPLKQEKPLRRTRCRTSKAACRLLMLTAFSSFFGCLDQAGVKPADSPEVVFAQSDDRICDAIDEVLSSTYHNRTLNTDDHAAWQILHGVLTYKRDFQIYHRGQNVSALDHALVRGTIKGWTFERGSLGPKAIVESGTKSGQGHADQWLAVVAQCGLAADHTVEVNGRMYTIGDWVRQVQFDVPRNAIEEYSWTLIGLTLYLSTDATWTGSDGETWSIEQLLRLEADKDINDSACGGTHRLIGMSMALNQHLAQHGDIDGVWKMTDRKIRDAIDLARRFQNPDGSFSTKYFSRPGTSVDLAMALSTTGHMVEFLTFSLTDEQLHEPWIKRAVWFLCDVFRRTESFDVECGGLYHAAHGLALYRERMFGPRSYRPTPELNADVNPAPIPPGDVPSS